MPNDPDPWRCSVCGATYAVPSLARDCENDHAALTAAS